MPNWGKGAALPIPRIRVDSPPLIAASGPLVDGLGAGQRSAAVAPCGAVPPGPEPLPLSRGCGTLSEGAGSEEQQARGDSMSLSCFDAGARISYALGWALPCAESRAVAICSPWVRVGGTFLATSRHPTWAYCRPWGTYSASSRAWRTRRSAASEASLSVRRRAGLVGRGPYVLAR